MIVGASLEKRGHFGSEDEAGRVTASMATNRAPASRRIHMLDGLIIAQKAAGGRAKISTVPRGPNTPSQPTVPQGSNNAIADTASRLGRNDACGTNPLHRHLDGGDGKDGVV